MAADAFDARRHRSCCEIALERYFIGSDRRI
jgi:hypothetical protein